MATNKFDKLKTTFTKGVATINVKTSVFLETAKIKTHIETIQNEIKDLKYEIGDIAYNLWVSDKFDISLIENNCLMISEKIKNIEELNQEIYRLENQEKEVFGSREKEIEESTKPDSAFVCPNCKAVYTSRINFCVKCGNKMS